MHTIYTATNGTIIGVVAGNKSPNDFRVKYQEVGKRERTPKHIHIIIDLYLKRAGDDALTQKLLEQILSVINQLQPVTQYPPTLQVFSPSDVQPFLSLNKYGEYPVDFLLVTLELIQIQEKTNYPNGTMNFNLFYDFWKREDIFKVVSAATFR